LDVDQVVSQFRKICESPSSGLERPRRKRSTLPVVNPRLLR